MVTAYHLMEAHASGHHWIDMFVLLDNGVKKDRLRACQKLSHNVRQLIFRANTEADATHGFGKLDKVGVGLGMVRCKVSYKENTKKKGQKERTMRVPLYRF